MERFRYRSTSLVDLMAELHQRDLLAEASRLDEQRRAPVRRRALRFGLPILGRRRKG
ncbi:MAG: hypothetical protein ACRDFY_09965 [Candidatus Limnocylindria bacterium]